MQYRWISVLLVENNVIDIKLKLELDIYFRLPVRLVDNLYIPYFKAIYIPPLFIYACAFYIYNYIQIP